MSVHRRQGSPNYHYEFQIKGARFRGSTGETSEREAKRAEARIRAEIEARLAAGMDAREQKIQMTLGEAAARFWTEKGQHEADADSVWYQMENLVDGLGRNTLISMIGMSELAEYQARRRGQKNRNGKFPSSRSINAECPELIRRIYNRAEDVWSDERKGVRVDTGPVRKWSKLRLRLPKPRARELSLDEEKRLFTELRPDYHAIVEFALITGLRRAALILRWDQVDLDAGVIRYNRKSLYDGDIGILPVTDRVRQMLIAEHGRHRTHVWTYVARATRTATDAVHATRRGKRYPITVEGLKTEMRRAVKESGLTDWRVIHDLRHTAATRTLRSSKNLKAVQAMLAHDDIASTARYAHVLLEDVRTAMDAANPRKNPAIVENGNRKTR